jgi:hypothetical protein
MVDTTTDGEKKSLFVFAEKNHAQTLRDITPSLNTTSYCINSFFFFSPCLFVSQVCFLECVLHSSGYSILNYSFIYLLFLFALPPFSAVLFLLCCCCFAVADVFFFIVFCLSAYSFFFLFYCTLSFPSLSLSLSLLPFSISPWLNQPRDSHLLRSRNTTKKTMVC